MAGAILFKLTAVLQADAVISAGNIAVGNADVLRMVKVDAVTVAYLQVVQQLNAVNNSTVTADEVNCPVSAFPNRDIPNGQIAHIGKREDMRTWVESLWIKRLQFIRIRQFCSHECDAVTMNGSLSPNGYVLGMTGIEPHHSFSFVCSEGTEPIDRLVGVSFKDRCCLKIQFHI